MKIECKYDKYDVVKAMVEIHSKQYAAPAGMQWQGEFKDYYGVDIEAVPIETPAVCPEVAE